MRTETASHEAVVVRDEPRSLVATLLGMTLRHVNDVPVISDPKLLLEVADAAHQDNVPRLLKLLSMRRASRRDFQLLITVFTTIFARMASRNALGAFARDLGQLSSPFSEERRRPESPATRET